MTRAKFSDVSDPKSVGIEQQRTFYDGLWADVSSIEPNSHEVARLCAMLPLLETVSADRTAPRRVLEVGCGRGWLSGLVLSRFGEVTAFDLSDGAVAKARDAFPEIWFEVRDVFDSPVAEGHDLVVASEVIEHVGDQPRFMELLVDAVDVGGYVLLTTPNARLWKRWSREPTFRPQPLENWLTPRQLRQLVSDRCEIVCQSTTFFDVGHDGVYRLVNNAITRRMHRLGRRDPLPLLLGRAGLGLYQVILGKRR